MGRRKMQITYVAYNIYHVVKCAKNQGGVLTKQKEKSWLFLNQRIILQCAAVYLVSEF